MSAMASKATVVWLRDELRVHDNALLAEAARRGAPVLPVFCLDPRVFDALPEEEARSHSVHIGAGAGSGLPSRESWTRPVRSGVRKRPEMVLAEMRTTKRT